MAQAEAERLAARDILVDLMSRLDAGGAPSQDVVRFIAAQRPLAARAPPAQGAAGAAGAALPPLQMHGLAPAMPAVVGLPAMPAYGHPVLHGQLGVAPLPVNAMLNPGLPVPAAAVPAPPLVQQYPAVPALAPPVYDMKQLTYAPKFNCANTVRGIAAQMAHGGGRRDEVNMMLIYRGVAKARLELKQACDSPETTFADALKALASISAMMEQHVASPPTPSVASGLGLADFWVTFLTKKAGEIDGTTADNAKVNEEFDSCIKATILTHRMYAGKASWVSRDDQELWSAAPIVPQASPAWATPWATKKPQAAVRGGRGGGAGFRGARRGGGAAQNYGGDAVAAYQPYYAAPPPQYFQPAPMAPPPPPPHYYGPPRGGRGGRGRGFGMIQY